MAEASAVELSRVGHAYGSRQALTDITLTIPTSEIFVFVGPNGGGKSTLFRLLTTLIPPQQGQLTILGHDARQHAAEIRPLLGIVFQSPSLDKKLTVRENLQYHGAVHGMPRRIIRQRIPELLAAWDLSDRATDLVERLSGGLRRRVELAKALLPSPKMLLMDEPSTGLDPAIRRELWERLRAARDEAGLTVILTTHFMDEAERADRVAILDQGRLVALGSPEELRARIGGKVVSLASSDPERLAARIQERFGVAASIVTDSVRLELPREPGWTDSLLKEFPDAIDSLTLGKPTLEDVFIAETGHYFGPPGESENGGVGEVVGRA